MSPCLRNKQNLFLVTVTCLLVALWWMPASSQQKPNSRKNPPKAAPQAPPTQNLPPGIQEMMKSVPDPSAPGPGQPAQSGQASPAAGQPASNNLPPGIQEMMGVAPTPETPKTGTKPAPNPRGGRSLSNEDFGAPSADEVRDRQYKRLAAEYTSNEEQWRGELKTAREELERARAEQGKTPVPAQTPAPAAAGATKAVETPAQPVKTKDQLLLEELAKAKPDEKVLSSIADGTYKPPDPAAGTPAAGPTTAAAPAEKPVDRVREAQERLDTLVRLGRDRRYQENPTTPVAQPVAQQPAKPAVPEKTKPKKPEPKQEPQVIEQ